MRFRDFDNADKPGEEVWISQDDSIHVEQRKINGQDAVCAKLSDLLPAALQSSTPMKSKHTTHIPEYSEDLHRHDRCLRTYLSSQCDRI